MSGRPRGDRLGEDAVKADFRIFLALVWRHLGLPSPTPVQFDIARWLQRGPRRKAIMAFRGVGKSWIYAAYLCWRLYCDPDVKILVVSATKPLADSVAVFVRRLLSEMPLLRPLAPGRASRDSATVFDVGPARAAKDPSVRSVGIAGQITGARADEILADDVETSSNADTHAARARLAERIREFDAVLKPGGRVAFLGTPQSFDTIYEALPDRGYAIRIWPAAVPEDAAVYRGRLAPMVTRMIARGARPGDPVDPVRFDATDLAERRASWGAAGFALQYMLDLSQEDATRHPLRIADLVCAPGLDRATLGPLAFAGPLRAPDDPLVARAAALLGSAPRFVSIDPADRAPFAASVMAIDPSGRGADETAYAVVKALGGRLFLTAAGGSPGGYDDATLARLAAVAAEEEARTIVVEATFGDGMFSKLIQPYLAQAGVRARLEEAKPALRKERRILGALEPLTAQGRLVVAEEVLCADLAVAERSPERSLFLQIARMTADRGALAHDDRVDALALAVEAISGALGGPDAAAQARARREKSDAALLAESLKPRRRAAARSRIKAARGRWRA